MNDLPLIDSDTENEDNNMAAQEDPNYVILKASACTINTKTQRLYFYKGRSKHGRKMGQNIRTSLEK
jgi:hypothetical protein